MMSYHDAPMKTLLKQMFTGFILHEKSWDSEKEDYTRDIIDCMIEACDGDTIRGNMIHLFDHWSNDIQAMAPYYGLELTRDVNNNLVINEQVPQAPSTNHYWNDGKWEEMPLDELEETQCNR
jgi:hypothetical protein